MTFDSPSPWRAERAPPPTCASRRGDAGRDPAARVDDDGDDGKEDESDAGAQGTIPRPWLDALEPCGGFAAAIAFPDSLYAEAASVVAEIAVARADSIGQATRGDAAARGGG